MKNKIVIISMLVIFISTLITVYSQEKVKRKIVYEPKIITTNYDSLAPLLKYNGWEKLTDSEKVSRIRSWKGFNKNIGISEGPMPNNGLIKDELTAIRIAEIYLYGMYGEDIYFYVPYIAVKLNDSIWHVAGTTPPGWFGGISMDINSINGQVLAIGKIK